MNIKYIKNIFKVLKWPITFIIGQFLIQFIFVLFFNFKTSFKFVNTTSYEIELSKYLDNYNFLIALISFIIFFLIFQKNYQKFKNNYMNKINISGIIILVLFGVSISIIYNLIVYYLNLSYNFTTLYDVSSTNLLIQIICSGILGPILEEYLFRGIVYNNLKTFNKTKTSIIITTIIFSIVHTNIINSIYAFLIGFIFIYAYEKYKNINACIIIHMAANTSIIFMLYIIIKNILWLNIIIFIISLLAFIILYNKISKKRE